MFSIHRELFLAWEKVRLVKNLSSSGSHYFHSPHFLPLFGKPPSPYLDFSGIAEEDWRHFLNRIGDILISLHDAIAEFGFRAGKLDSNWNKLFSKITRCTWWKLVDLQIIVIWWAHIRYQIRKYTLKEFIVPHIFLAIGNKE